MLHRPDGVLARQVFLARHVVVIVFLPSLRVWIAVLAFLGGYVLPSFGYKEKYHIAPCMRRRQGF